MKILIPIITATLCLFLFMQHKPIEAIEIEKPKISFTFDDPITDDFAQYPNDIWNQAILNVLKKHRLKTVLFVCGKRIDSPKGKKILNLWNKAGHKIANHSYTHAYYNNKNITIKQFKDELLKNDSIINQYSNYYPYFRFPFLKEGNTTEKINDFRAFMKAHGYHNGHVSIDASDWYICNRLVKKLTLNSKIDVKPYQDYYINHIAHRAQYYDSLSTQLTQRKIKHVLLLHHNLTSALFLDKLITYFKTNGWDVIDATDAYTDSFYNTITSINPAGESLVWSLAKQSSKFEKVLRYPAEDGEYEEEPMNKLGL